VAEKKESNGQCECVCDLRWAIINVHNTQTEFYTQSIGL
jgi:hypothetical protein